MKAIKKLVPALIALIVILIIIVAIITKNKEADIKKTTQYTNETTLSSPSPKPSILPTPTPLPSPTPTPFPSPIADQVGNDSIRRIKYNIYLNNTMIADYKPEDTIIFGDTDSFTNIEGITTFRSNNYRDSAAFGTREVIAEELEIVWETNEVPVVDWKWPGFGWTGQPLIVHWDEKIRVIMNIYPEFKNKDLVEIIQTSMNGNIYFLDLETGKSTRPVIKTGFPIKGTPSIDPGGYPILYTGMGINKLSSGETSPFYFRIFNLIDQSLMYKLPGKDPVAKKSWAAFDSSPLIHKETDTLFQCGENGLVYKIKLNTEFDEKNKGLSINPETIKYQYTHTRLGIENSPAVYRDLMYFADNAGLLQCIDLNRLEPKWTYNLNDDTDSTIVIDDTDKGVFLYTGNEVDLQGSSGYASIRKLNALTGELEWEKSYKCWKGVGIDGGVLATPAIGTGDIENLIIYSITLTEEQSTAGKLIAFDKETGDEVWVNELAAYGWSSPTLFKSDEGKSYMIFCDSAGKVYLMNPKDGKVLDEVSLEKNIEASPAIYNDMIVIGSYARKVFGIRIK
jgi:outer membrane protein assembly factor BamB